MHWRQARSSVVAFLAVASSVLMAGATEHAQEQGPVALARAIFQELEPQVHLQAFDATARAALAGDDVSGTDVVHYLLYDRYQLYLMQHLSDEAFLTRIYAGVLGGVDTPPAEHPTWLRHLQAGLPRENIVEAILRGEAFAERCQAFGVPALPLSF